MKWENPDAPVQGYIIELSPVPRDSFKSRYIPNVIAIFDEINQYGVAIHKSMNEYNIDDLEPGQHYRAEIIGVIQGRSVDEESFEFYIFSH